MEKFTKREQQEINKAAEGDVYSPNEKRGFFIRLRDNGKTELSAYQIRMASIFMYEDYGGHDQWAKISEDEMQEIKAAISNEVWLHNMIHWPSGKMGRDEIVADLGKWMAIMAENGLGITTIKLLVTNAIRFNEERVITLKDVMVSTGSDHVWN